MVGETVNNIEIINNVINISEKGNKYSFDCQRLSLFSTDVRDYEIEYVFADLKNDYLTVITTVASGQAGIIAVVDIREDDIIHFQNGAYAISAMVADNKVISFHDVSSYGHAPFYTIDVIDFGNMNMDVEPKSMNAAYESDFYNGIETISMSLDGTALILSNGNITYTEDISDLI